MVSYAAIPAQMVIDACISYDTKCSKIFLDAQERLIEEYRAKDLVNWFQKKDLTRKNIIDKLSSGDPFNEWNLLASQHRDLTKKIQDLLTLAYLAKSFSKDKEVFIDADLAGELLEHWKILD